MSIPSFVLVQGVITGLGYGLLAMGLVLACSLRSVAAEPVTIFAAATLQDVLDAVDDPVERQQLFDSMVERAYEHGKAINVASAFEIDDVIDPADSRRRLVDALRSSPAPAARTGKKRSCIDSW